MNIKNFLIGIVSFLAIDAVWLQVIASKMYKEKIGHLMASKANLIPAVVFYLLFVVALLFFVIQPGLAEKNILKTVLSAAFFGMITYATYDLTNFATLKDWPLSLTLIDIAWGSVLSALTALVIMLFNR